MDAKLDALKATYTQNADDLDNVSDDVQTIEIKTVDSGAGVYYVISTRRWAVAGAEELTELLHDFIRRLEQADEK